MREEGQEKWTLSHHLQPEGLARDLRASTTPKPTTTWGPRSEHPGRKPPGARRMRTGPPRRTPRHQPPRPPPPPRRRQAPRRRPPPHAGARPRNPAAAGASSRAPDEASPGSQSSGSHLPWTCKRRKPGNVSSDRGAAGALRTCFSLSSPPSWFQRQAAAAELPNASMEATRR